MYNTLFNRQSRAGAAAGIVARRELMIDPEKLRRFSIPETRQHITKEDVAFYALSVGLGQDPLDPQHLRFVDYRKPLLALPSMLTVLAHPGFWLAHPETGVDPACVVHGEQRIDVRGPLPVEGEIIGRTRITGLVDKGPGKGALLYSEKVVTDARSGATLGIAASTSFLRGQGGFGGPAGPEVPTNAVPERAPDFAIEATTRPEQALYYRMNGDDNPLHADPAAAARAGFPRPVLHGLCTFGVVCHAVIHLLAKCNPADLSALSLRFSHAVFPGETIRTEVWTDGSFRARVVERDLVVVNNGRATVALKASSDMATH